jgi:hypothetical protein
MRYSKIEQCLQKYIGLVDEKKLPPLCPCLNEKEKLNAAFSAGSIFSSESGYFISDLIDFDEAVFSIKKCDKESVFSLLNDARTLATKDLISDLQMNIMDSYDSRYTNDTSKLGETKETNIIQSNEWSSIIISYDQIKGGGLYIDEIAIGLADGTGRTDISLFVYKSSDMSNPIWSTIGGLSATGGTWTNIKLCDPIYLPFKDYDDCEVDSYVIMWDSLGDNVFKNKTDCGCGSKTKYKQHYNVQGATFNGGDMVNCSRHTFGLSIKAKFICNPLDYICTLQECGDYAMSNVLSKALQFKAASNMVTQILDSNNINYYTLLNRENLFGKISHFEKRYGEYVDYITDQMEHRKYSDCLKCKESKRRIFKKSILV